MRILNWSEPKPPNEDCAYDHVEASTPMGIFRITWKGWKDHPSYVVEVPYGDFFGGSYDSLEEAMEMTEKNLWTILE